MRKLLSLKSILITTLVLIVILGSAQLVLANELSTEGQKIRESEAQRCELENEIQVLKKNVARLGSFSRIEEQAVELGFKYNPQAFEYLSYPKLAQVQ